jgi:Tfp pilus assembly protein PilN
MSHAVANAMGRFFESGTVKSITISAIMALLGFASHQLLEVNTQQAMLEQHTAQLQKLGASADATAAAVQGLAVTTARIDGKLDVLKQRLDDSRSEGHVVRSASAAGSPVR